MNITDAITILTVIENINIVILSMDVAESDKWFLKKNHYRIVNEIK
ncbi:hypothetical protein DZJ_09930 [Dickeya ananatis]